MHNSVQRILRVAQNLWHRAGQPGGVEHNQRDVSLPRDPLVGERNNTLSMDQVGGYFAIGQIINVFPNLHTYHVQLSGHGIMHACTTLCSTSLNPMSTQDATTLTVMSRVLVFKPVGSTTGLILGVIPGYASDTSTQFPDFFVPMGNAGLNYEKMYSFAGHPGCGVPGFVSGRPGDVLPGDMAYMNELGLGLLIGRTLATLKAGDMSKIEMFYMDNLLRLCAGNFEHFGPGFERRMLDDEGEITDIELLTMFPWEGLGQQTQTNAFNEKNDEVWRPGKEDAFREPKDPDQDGIWRMRTFRGYLGDAERKIISAPGVATSSAAPDDTGLFEQIIGTDGSFTLRSAKRVIISKDVMIPVPKRQKREDDPSGDSPHDFDNPYNSAGLKSEEAFNRKLTVTDRTPSAYAAQADEIYSYATSRRSNQVFKNHKKDWKVPSSSDMQFGGSSVQQPLKIPKGSFEATLPESRKVRIDHREEDAEFFLSRSGIYLLDDGSIVFEAAYGEQIRMSGGHIILSCPGNVFLQSGKDLVAWAGKDVVLRARKSADLTAGNGDLRLKAERNMQMLAGNGGQGGVTIESKASGAANDFEKPGTDAVSAGVLIKSEHAPFLVHTHDMYLRTLSTGVLALDAGAGDGSILMNAKQISANVTDNFNIAIGGSLKRQDSPPVTHFFGRVQSVIDSQLIVNGQAAIFGPTLIDGAMIANGTVAGTNTMLAQVPDDFEEKSIAPAKKALADFTDKLSSSLATAGKALYEADFAWGNDLFIESVRVTLRTDDQYGLSGFVIFESPWQTLTDTHWTEPVVKGPDGEETFPHPGQKNWLTGTSFARVKSQLFDPATGRPIDGDSATVVLGAATRDHFAGVYKVAD